jgi:hypothetical protein
MPEMGDGSSTTAGLKAVEAPAYLRKSNNIAAGLSLWLREVLRFRRTPEIIFNGAD